MMIDQDEIIDFIRGKVAAFKARSLDDIDVDARFIEDIHLTGDDFTEIDYLLGKKYRVATHDSDYHEGMSIRDWASMIFRKSGGIQS